MLVLGIETSCDETAAAVVEDGRRILSEVTLSQIPIHRKWGGVVPELAFRRHLETINEVVEEALRRAAVRPPHLDGIAVTDGPGLAGCLLIGVACAEGLRLAFRKPLVGVHHLEAHLWACAMDPGIRPPFLGLIVSGGHTELVEVIRWGKYRLIGRTLDDAAGEAFDKVARVLGLGYPGGPEIQRAASAARPGYETRLPLPVPILSEDPGYLRKRRNGASPWNFSFSGLKTAAARLWLSPVIARSPKGETKQSRRADLAASFQDAAALALTATTIAAAKARGHRRIAVCGGVAANARLREVLGAACEREGFSLAAPPLSLCTDNAAMVAGLGFLRLAAGRGTSFAPRVDPDAPLRSWNGS